MERRFIRGRQLRLEPRQDNQPPKIVGYAAVFWRENDPATQYDMSFWGFQMFERIMPGAFDRAVREDDVRALLNHNENLILGRNKAQTLSLAVDEIGLFYQALPPDNQVGRDAVESIRRGDIDGSSFCFEPVKTMIIEEDDGTIIRELHELKLWDVSPCVFPAYQGTTSEVRSDRDAGGLLAEVERWRKGKAQRQAMLARARVVEIDADAIP